MNTQTSPRLIGLGSARRQTRADSYIGDMELIPVRLYEPTGVRADVVRLGSAEQGTRADSPTGDFELIPVRLWQQG